MGAGMVQSQTGWSSPVKPLTTPAAKVERN